MILLAALALQANAAAPLSPPTPAQRAAILRFMNTELIDGPSARWLWPVRRGRGDFYCGWVNSRNRMGGYTGWTPYWVRLDGPLVADGRVIADNGVMSQVFGEECQRQGYDVITPPRN